MKHGKLFGSLACTGCGKLLDGYTDVSGKAEPNDGDFSICAYCRKVHVYVAHALLGWSLRPATGPETIEAFAMLLSRELREP